MGAGAGLAVVDEGHFGDDAADGGFEFGDGAVVEFAQEAEELVDDPAEGAFGVCVNRFETCGGTSGGASGGSQPDLPFLIEDAVGGFVD